MIKALVFDFDGMIIDSESTAHQSWVELYREYGYELRFEDWAQGIGTIHTPYDPGRALEELSGQEIPWDVVGPRRRQRELELLHQLPVLPGVLDYLQAAREKGLKIGLASSAPHIWVDGHLARLGLQDYFQAVFCNDDVELTKPDPALYRITVQALGVQPDEALALEDSSMGVLAARRAGLYCVAVPNNMTRRMNIEGADFYLDSLANLSLDDLLDLVNALPSRNGRQT